MGWKVKKEAAWLDLLLLFIGQYALTKILEEVRVITWDITPSLWLGMGFLALLWGLYRLPGRWPTLAAMGIFLMGSLWYLLGSENLQGQLTRILGSFGGNVTGNVTTAMTFLMAWVAMLLFLVEIVLNLHWPLLLAGAALPLACPFMAIPLNLPGMFALVVFLLGFWLWKRLKNPGKSAPADKKTAGSFRRLGAGLLAGVCCLFALSWLVAEATQQTLYTIPYQVESAVVKAVRQQMGGSLDMEDGSVSRGNVYAAGVLLMDIYANQQPTSTIYLHQSSRGDYENGQWEDNWDEEIYERLEQSGVEWESWIGVEWDRLSDGERESWSGTLRTLMDSLIYELNYRYLRTEPIGLGIYLVESDQTSKPMPYFSQAVERQIEGGYGAYYYPISLLAIPWNRVSDEEPLSRELLELYRREALDYYTRLPSGQLTKFRQLVEANPLESLEEVTMFIHHTLTTYATYTQAPGMFPLNADPAEYFLFESGRGYCQHFASAAVILYRMYGIPARYATGYSVKPSDFTLENGEYHAEVTDESAHAWVEICMPDYGWVPVEMTPGGPKIPELPGIPASTLQEVLKNQNWDFTILQPPEPELPQTRPQEYNPTTRPQTQEKSINLMPLLWTGLIVVIVLGAYRGRKWLLARQRRLPPKVLYARMVEGLHFAGLLTGLDGQEADFAAQLSAVLPELESLDIPTVLLLVDRDAYDREPLPEESRQAVWQFYETAMTLTAQRLPWWKKLIFRYGKLYF